MAQIKYQNEVFIEADEDKTNIYLDALNKVCNEEKIPSEWQEGELIRIYK